jgi:hypothetical protein
MELVSETAIADFNVLEQDKPFIDRIAYLDQKLENRFSSIMHVDNSLNRQIVSFQANKKIPFYRWYKYKEGFSADLVIHYLNKYDIEKANTVLDPFAGSGAALFAASDLGINSIGIELLPIGQELIKSRNLLLNDYSDTDFSRLFFWKEKKPWINQEDYIEYNVLKITNGAYSDENDSLIKKYLACMKNENTKVQQVLLFALICILENISFTRKDGQYLRWDQRSGRCIGARPFNKGEIKQFNHAISEKLEEIISDSKGLTMNSLFDFKKPIKQKGAIQIIGGSCLFELPNIKGDTIDFVMTSPPYCNRYDYTRTYALELAMLGIDEKKLLALRQEMLSCTVENREKDLLGINPNWIIPLNLAQNHDLLQEIISFLEFKKISKTLNNNGLPRMIKGYFYEMSCVVYELHRVLKKGGRVIMVNDNVRYAGASISVDLILSDIANQIGFTVDEISILPIGKGNSSQQMGEHGRESLRKCVYIWRKE